jgi:hypothetical protein
VKIAAMQPYFFPYLGQFDLLNRVDLWIAYDAAQYIRHGWVNRNRVLHPVSGWQYLIVPLKKHHHRTPINRIEIADGPGWKTAIVRRLEHYRTEAPGYESVLAFVKDGLSGPESGLARLNVALFRNTAERLGIGTPIRVFSEMEEKVPPHDDPQDLALKICRAAGADEYVNPPGGKDLYDPAAFAAAGVRLTIQPWRDMSYSCGRFGFEPALSVLDVMMWNPVERIKAHLDASRNAAAEAPRGRPES